MKFAHKLTLALLVVLAVVLSLCNTVLIGQQFRQELHTAQETLSADWQRESRAMQRTLVTPGSGSLAARVGSYLQAITEQNSLACAAYSVDGTSLYYALPTAVPLSEVEALLAQDGEPRMVLANNHTLLCAGTVVLPERCITLVIAQDAAPVWQARQARTRNALIVELLAMVLAGGLVLLLCRRMTRPLEQLEQASRQIAAGAYSQRTAIHGSDEIASLSRSFDEMAQAVEGTVQTLQQNARQKDDFVAAFTHELKTPMTSILGFADILRSGEVSPATRRTAADYIYHESKRLEALSGNLLALMGLEQQPPQLEAVPLGRVLQSLRRALLAHPGHRHRPRHRDGAHRGRPGGGDHLPRGRALHGPPAPGLGEVGRQPGRGSCPAGLYHQRHGPGPGRGGDRPFRRQAGSERGAGALCGKPKGPLCRGRAAHFAGAAVCRRAGLCHGTGHPGRGAGTKGRAAVCGRRTGGRRVGPAARRAGCGAGAGRGRRHSGRGDEHRGPVTVRAALPCACRPNPLGVCG